MKQPPNDAFEADKAPSRRHSAEEGGACAFAHRAPCRLNAVLGVRIGGSWGHAEV